MDHPGVPLASYSALDADVLLTCSKCCKWRVLGLEAVITRLIERGIGDENTGIREVARFIAEPCSCGKVSWLTTPAFHHPNMPGMSMKPAKG